jgi:hypothetical protein
VQHFRGGRARRLQAETRSERMFRRLAVEPIADGETLRATRLNLKVQPDASGVRDFEPLLARPDLRDANRRQSLAGHD